MRLTGCLYLTVPKDLAKHWTDMILLYNVTLHRSWEGKLSLLYKVLSVFCLSWRISLTAKPVLFFFTVKLLIGPGKVFDYFWGGCLHPSSLQKYLFTLLKLKFKKGWGQLFLLLPQVPLEASRGVAASI